MPDPSFVLPLLWQSALLPFALAMVVLALLRRTVLAASAGFLACFIAVFHSLWSPLPKQALDWMPWIVLAAGLLTIFSETPKRAWIRALIRLATAMGTAFAVAMPAIAGGALAAPFLPVLTAGFAMSCAWMYTARAASSRDTPPVLLAMLAAGAALVMMLDASQLLGQLAGGLASALGACVAFRVARGRHGDFGEAACGIAVLILGALLLNAYIYAALSPLYIALLGVSLLADMASEMIDRLRGHARGTGALVTAGLLAVVPVAAAIGFAVKAMQDSGGY